MTQFTGSSPNPTTFTWDDLSRITSHAVNNLTMVFVYDFAGIRIMSRKGTDVKTFFIFESDRRCAPSHEGSATSSELMCRTA